MSTNCLTKLGGEISNWAKYKCINKFALVQIGIGTSHLHTSTLGLAKNNLKIVFKYRYKYIHSESA